MSLRREREQRESQKTRIYEAGLLIGVAVVGAGLLAAFGAVLYATVLSPRPGAVGIGALEPGLVGAYRSGAAFQRVDEEVDFDEGDPRLPAGPFEATWSGYLHAPRDGNYAFTLSASGEARLRVGGREVGRTGALELTAGFHELKIDLAHREGRPRCRLWWEPTGHPRERVPSSALSHPASLAHR
jgi:hypothetical protein